MKFQHILGAFGRASTDIMWASTLHFSLLKQCEVYQNKLFLTSLIGFAVKFEIISNVIRAY